MDLINIIYPIISGVIIVYLLMGLRIIPVTKHAVILRNGRIHKVCNSGSIVWINPLIEKIVRVHPEYRTAKFSLKDVFIEGTQRSSLEIVAKFLIVEREGDDFLQGVSVEEKIENVLRKGIQDYISKESFENKDIFVSKLEKMLNERLLDEGIVIYIV